MASSGLKILLSVIVLFFFGVQVDCKVERFVFHIVEKGTPFNEEVEVDVEQQTEVFRVPQHNDVDPMELMNDFAAGLSVRRVPSTRDCYVFKLDTSLPLPQEMKFNMKQATKQPAGYPDTVTVKETATRVLGFANRLALPQRMLDFCGSFPIYNVEVISLDSMNASLHKTQGHGRRKRDHIHTTFNSCGYEAMLKYTDCMNKRKGLNFPIKCKYKTTTCFYTFICKHIAPNRKTAKHKCDIKAHYINHSGFCCEALCD